MKLTNAITISIFTASILLLQGCAGGFGKGDMKDRMLSRIDSNDDGFVDKEEYLAMSIKRFERADDNDDGKVTLEENQENRFSRFMPGMMTMWFEQNDLDKNGSVDRQEVEKATAQAFTESDLNQDQKLSFEEIETYRKNQRFNSMDKNSDEQVSRKEFLESKTPFH